LKTSVIVSKRRKIIFEELEKNKEVANKKEESPVFIN
jgi:hypothetical protein